MIETSDSDAWIPLQRPADEEHALRSVEHELRAEFPWVPSIR